METDPAEADSEARDLVFDLVSSLHHLRHVDLDTIGALLGLAIPAEFPGPSHGSDIKRLSKRERLDRTFDTITPSDYLSVCTRFMKGGDLSSELRNRVEDLLWSREYWPIITVRTRREIAEALDRVDTIWLDGDRLLALVRRHWVLGSIDWMLGKDPYEPVIRHMIRNPGDWSTVEFFKQVGAFEGRDRRFALFIEGLLSGSVNPDETRQRRLAAAIAPVLARVGMNIVESGTLDGYPAFTITSTGGQPRPAQLILFAGQHRKPSLRLRDVLDQEIEVLSDDNTVLAYDAPVGERGLTWSEVEAWWSRRRGVQAHQAKKELWQRLRQVCANASPAQEALLVEYYGYAKRHDPLYALLPEVWLHWDPISRRQRGEDAYLNQRMDFLMLLPGLRRVVLEVDGEQHYATPARQPSPRIYSETTRGDRDLRLAGYEVYRFSGFELLEDRAAQTVSEFFDRLMARNP